MNFLLALIFAMFSSGPQPDCDAPGASSDDTCAAQTADAAEEARRPLQISNGF